MGYCSGSFSPERFHIEGFVGANFDNSRGGPGSVAASVREIQTVLDKAGMADRWPVYHGSDPMRYQYEPSDSEGVDFIIEKALASTPDDPLWVIGLGSATDIASAVLKEPRIIERVNVSGICGPVGLKNVTISTCLAMYGLPDCCFMPRCLLYCSTPVHTCGARWRNLPAVSHRMGPWALISTNTDSESPYFMDPRKGFFDLGDIAALVNPDIACWDITPVLKWIGI